jgi:hypothetical protein
VTEIFYEIFAGFKPLDVMTIVLEYIINIRFLVGSKSRENISAFLLLV